MIQAQIFNAISQSPDVISLAGTRIYPIRLPPEAVLPALVYQLPNTVPVNSLDGDSGIDLSAVEVVAWAKDYSIAHQLAYAARKALLEESGLRMVTESIVDGEDFNTHSYSVTSGYSIWSENNIGISAPSVLSPVYSFAQYEFVGDGATVDFTFPDTFRAGSLVMYINGIVVKKNMYVEKTNKNGVIFNTAPTGGDYQDELLAFYAKT